MHITRITIIIICIIIIITKTYKAHMPDVKTNKKNLNLRNK